MFWVSWYAEWYLEVVCVATVSEKKFLDPEKFLSYLTAIFKPTTFLEPVFQPAKISLWMWNRGDAIMLLNTTSCNKF
jgi:hypothetical protein